MTLSKQTKELSRRSFLTIAGGAASLAALAALGLTMGSKAYGANIQKMDIDKIEYENNEADVLVVGSGMAGLFAAVKAHDAGARVILVSKGRLGASGQTPFAKGIFVYDALNSTVSLDEFCDTVSRSALGTNNPVYTRQMAEQSMARVNELREWGFFDSHLYHQPFHKPIAQRNIPVIDRVVMTHLIKENGKMAGAAGFSLDGLKVHTFRAKSVILCTGAGGFKPNGFPICDLTHDGTIMAYNIGAKVTGKEWNDGHPGQAANPAACFDGWHGMFERKPVITGIEVHHDLGVDLNYKVYKTGSPVRRDHPGMTLENDITGGPYRPAEFNRSRPEHFKGDHKSKEGPGNGQRPPQGEPPGAGGPPPGMGGTPVGGSSAGMSIHKSEGLVPINENCESNIPGLYAAGDALGSHMAGAIYTQVGSSLAGSAVQGAVAGMAAARYCQDVELPKISEVTLKTIHEQMLAPLKRKSGYGPAWVTQTLQGIMIPNFVLYIKKENMLRAALAYIEELRDHHVPFIRAADMHELRLAHETSNMILNAEMKLRASIMRKESRCSHFRLDYPEPDYENWNAWINIYKGPDGKMKLEKQDFASWPS